jgi:hypothetical protein
MRECAVFRDARVRWNMFHLTAGLRRIRPPSPTLPPLGGEMERGRRRRGGGLR